MESRNAGQPVNRKKRYVRTKELERRRAMREQEVRNQAAAGDNVRPLRPEDFQSRPSSGNVGGATQRSRNEGTGRAYDSRYRPRYEQQSRLRREEESAPRSTPTRRPAGPDPSRPSQKAERSAATAAKRPPKKRKRYKRVPKEKAGAVAFTLPQRQESDFTLIASIILLSFIGIVMVTSSSYYSAYNKFGDSFHFFRRQIMWLGIGVVAMVVASKFPLAAFKKLAFPAYILANICLVLVLLVGSEKNGSQRWLGVGSLSFQPAELAKIAVALYMAYLVEKHGEDITSLKTFCKLLIVLMIPTILVFIENLSSAIIIAAMGVIIMFVGGVRLKHLFCIGIPIIAVGVFLVVLPKIPSDYLPEILQKFSEAYAYRAGRVWAWMDPWAYAQNEGYQIIQSLYAVGSGGIFGVGLGQSIQKLGFIPEAHNDIIFSIICEELGLFGAGVVLLLFFLLIWHGIKICIYAPNRFTSLVAAGLVGQVAIQVVLNVAVNTNTIPATGISLPFISYGGSSLLFLMASMGILLNISQYTRRNSAG